MRNSQAVSRDEGERNEERAAPRERFLLFAKHDEESGLLASERKQEKKRGSARGEATLSLFLSPHTRVSMLMGPVNFITFAAYVTASLAYAAAGT